MTTTILPAAWAPLHAALRARRPVIISYHGRHRIVCPHALGRKTSRPMVIAYKPADKPAPGRSPPTPDRDGGACTSTKSPTSLLTQTSAWATADNYNPAHPFPAIDHITIAVSCAVPQRTLGGPSHTVR